MSNTNEDIANDWRSEIEKRLHESKLYDILIPYPQVSNAFPGGPHLASLDMQRIDWDTLQSWAENLGWHVQGAPEKTHPSQLSTPEIRFIRITHG